MPALSKEQIHRRVLESLGPDGLTSGPLAAIPFLIELDGLVPLAVYAFTITDPPGGRDADELKIQLIVPGQGRGERGTLEEPDDDTFLILLGYSQKYDVFVLWDAYLHRDFAFSKNCQVRLQAIVDAQLTGLGRQTRQLRSGLETVIVARPDHLREALSSRVRVG